MPIKKRLKSTISLTLLIIIFSHVSLNAALPIDPVLPTAPETATPVSPAEHQRIIREYIDQIRIMHNKSFQLVQLTLDSPIKDAPALRHSINLINADIESVRRRIRNYLSTAQTTPTQIRDVLLLFNALNHTSNQMLYLNQLSYATTNIQKVLYLEYFYRSRQATIDTLTAVESFISDSPVIN